MKWVFTFAISGSAAIKLTNLLMLEIPSNMPSSMLISRTCAPFSTWSLATASASWKRSFNFSAYYISKRRELCFQDSKIRLTVFQFSQFQTSWSLIIIYRFQSYIELFFLSKSSLIWLTWTQLLPFFFLSFFLFVLEFKIKLKRHLRQ